MNADKAIDRSADLWRLMFAYERLIESLPAKRQGAAYAKARRLFGSLVPHVLDLLDPHGIRIVVFEGLPYEPNYPLEAVNADDFESGESLCVSTTLEPAFVQKGQVLRFAKVELTRQASKKNTGESHVHGN